MSLACYSENVVFSEHTCRVGILHINKSTEHTLLKKLINLHVYEESQIKNYQKY